jgi:hypothetical protein
VSFLSLEDEEEAIQEKDEKAMFIVCFVMVLVSLAGTIWLSLSAMHPLLLQIYLMVGAGFSLFFYFGLMYHYVVLGRFFLISPSGRSIWISGIKAFCGPLLLTFYLLLIIGTGDMFVVSCSHVSEIWSKTSSFEKFLTLEALITNLVISGIEIVGLKRIFHFWNPLG